ncbi:MAG TPA: hypothetical protein VH912_22830 [Streptosporangiaceae bacterium]
MGYYLLFGPHKELRYGTQAALLRAVQVFAAAEDKTKDQYFTILVNGRPVVQNAGCLGADCRKKD